MRRTVFFALALLVISGCGTGGSKATGTNEINVFRGTDGIITEFIKGNPPEAVYVGKGKTEFYAFLSVDNKGAYNIDSGYLNLLIEKDYVEFADDVARPIKFALAGRTKDDPMGGHTEGSFRLYAKGLDENSVSKKTQISAIFCHDYRTKAAVPVCVDADFLNRRVGAKPCAVKDESLSGQGAPVVVTKVETRMMPKEDIIVPSFIIYVENRGKGQVLNPDYIRAACSDEGRKEDMWNIIHVEASLGTQKLICSPYPLRLKNKGDFIKCELAQGVGKDEPTYSSVLTIDLRYGYTFTATKAFEIKRS